MWKVLKYGRYVAEVVRKDFYGHRWSLEISRKRLSACVSSPKVSPPKEERVFHSWVRRQNADDEQTEVDDAFLSGKIYRRRPFNFQHLPPTICSTTRSRDQAELHKFV